MFKRRIRIQYKEPWTTTWKQAYTSLLSSVAARISVSSCCKEHKLRLLWSSTQNKLIWFPKTYWWTNMALHEIMESYVDKVIGPQKSCWRNSMADGKKKNKASKTGICNNMGKHPLMGFTPGLLIQFHRCLLAFQHPNPDLVPDISFRFPRFAVAHAHFCRWHIRLVSKRRIINLTLKVRIKMINPISNWAKEKVEHRYYHLCYPLTSDNPIPPVRANIIVSDFLPFVVSFQRGYNVREQIKYLNPRMLVFFSGSATMSHASALIMFQITSEGWEKVLEEGGGGGGEGGGGGPSGLWEVLGGMGTAGGACGHKPPTPVLSEADRLI